MRGFFSDFFPSFAMISLRGKNLPFSATGLTREATRASVRYALHGGLEIYRSKRNKILGIFPQLVKRLSLR